MSNVHDDDWRRQPPPRRRGRAVLVLVVSLAVLAGVAGAGWWAFDKFFLQRAQAAEGCYAFEGEQELLLTHEQAGNAALIAGVAMNEEMGTQGAIVALATAFQESGLKNIDYGDRDSIGLFQQRPSMGWGTKEQIMDPVYSSKKFFTALRRVPNWQAGDVNDIAQTVQRSGVPEGYRKHITKAQLLGRVLTGQVPGGFSCINRREVATDITVVTDQINRTWAVQAKTTSPTSLTMKATKPDVAWAWAYQSIANMRAGGVTRVEVAGYTWEASPKEYRTWRAPTAAAKATTPIVITVTATPK